MTRFLLWTAALWASCFVGAAEEISLRTFLAKKPQYLLKNWKTEHGLPQDAVTSLAKTSDGYLWIGTYHGLARFDGSRFANFTTQSAPGLNGDDITCLAAGKSGLLWIGTKQGLSVYSPEKAMTVVTNIQETVFALCALSNGWVALSTAKTLWLFQDGKWRSWPAIGRNTAGQEETFYPSSMVQCGEKELAIGGHFGVQLWTLEPENDQPKLTAPRCADGGCCPLQNPGPGSILAAGGDLYLNGSAGLQRVRNGVVSRFGGHTARSEGVAVDTTGSVWFGCGGDLWRLNGENATLIESIPSLPSGHIKAIFTDRDGLVWVGTTTEGLFCLSPRTVQMITTDDGLANHDVWSISQGPSGRIWAATGDGISIWEDGLWKSYKELVDPYLKGTSCIFESQTGQIGANGKGPAILHAVGIKTIFANGSPNYIRTISEASDGRAWVLADDIWRQNADHSGFDAVPNMPPLRYAAFLEDKRSNIWIGSYAGQIVRFDEGNPAKPFFFSSPHGIHAHSVGPRCEDEKGIIWCASDSGLVFFDKGQFRTVTEKDGLPDNVVLDVLEDGEWLWMPSHHGIFRARKVDLLRAGRKQLSRVQCIYYGKRDGMDQTEGNGGTFPNSCKTKDGQLLFPTVGGIAVIHSGNISRSRSAPTLLLEQFSVDGAVLASHSSKSRFELSSKVNRIQILVNAPIFSHPELGIIECWLKGEDKEPRRFIGASQASLEYSHLKPGRYEFHARAANCDGIWSHDQILLSFFVSTAFYKRLEFLTASCLILALAAFSWHRLIIRREKELTALRAELGVQQERARIARDIHDTLGARLAQISLSQIKRSRNGECLPETQQARAAIQDLNELVWAINPRHDNIPSLGNFLTLYTENFFSDSDIRVSLDIPLHLPEDSISAPVRHQLMLATKEALTNVVKHARATEVNIALRVNGSHLELLIKDNGVGSASKQAEGDGLDNIALRMKEIGAHMEIAFNPTGTTLRLVAPLMDISSSPKS